MKSIVLPAFLTVFGLLCVSPAWAADTLMEKLKDEGWDGIAGTWVDEATGGRNSTTTYTWKLRDHVMEVRGKDGSKETIALMSLNGKNGKVGHMGADNQGASFLGEWKFEADGTSVVEMLFTSGDGQAGVLQVRQKMIGKDKMEISIPAIQLSFTVIRKK